MRRKPFWLIGVLLVVTLAVGGVYVLKGIWKQPIEKETCSTYMVKSINGGLICTMAHRYPVTSAAFSPDGRILAGADSSGRIVLSRAADCQLLHVMEGTSAQWSKLHFSHDGKLLAMINGQGETPTYDHIKVWQVPEGKQVDFFKNVLPPFTFSRDGRLFVANQNDGTLKVFSFSDGSVVRSLKGPIAGTPRVAITPDGKLIAAAYSSRILVWRTFDGNIVCSLTSPISSIVQLAFSPDSSILAVVGSSYPGIALFRVQDGVCVRRLGGEVLVTFSCDGKLLASMSDRKTVLIWNVADGALVSKLHVIKSSEGFVSDIVFLSHDRLLTVSLDDVGEIIDYVVSAFSYKGSKAIPIYSLEHRVLRDISPNGKLLAISGSPPRH